MRSLTNSFFLFIALFLISACSSTLKVKELDPQTGLLPTTTPLNLKSTPIRKALDLEQYSQMLYIQEGIEMEKYEDYILGTLENIGHFKSFYDKEKLEQLVVQKQLTDKVTSISDNIGLSNLSKELGYKFLVLETNVEHTGGYNFIFDFKLIDPSKIETIYHIRHKALNWSGLDRPLFNPVFNDYKKWLDKNSRG